MKVLIIYDHGIKERVEELRSEIAEKFGNGTILRLNSRNRAEEEKIKIKHIWHLVM